MEFKEALDVLGRKIGRFHVLTLTLISCIYVFQGVFFMSYVFTTLRSEHRCLIPECDNDDLEMSPKWLSAAVPMRDGVPDNCLRYVPVAPAPEDPCSPSAFTNQTQECDQWVYPNKMLSIMTEWDLTSCSAGGGDWKLTMVGTANNVGRALGLSLAGFLSDRFGRKAVLIGLLAVSGFIGIMRSMSPNYLFYIVFEFIDPIFYDGTGGTVLIMGMEILPATSRSAWSVASHVVFALALAGLGGVAWLVPYWRWMLRFLYSSAFLILPLLWFFLDESMLWLASKGRLADAQRIIRKAAKMNGSESTMNINFDKVELSGVSEDNLVECTAKKTSILSELGALLKSRILAFRLFNCCFSWVVILFVYEGLSINSVAMAGNSYVNFILVVLIEIPGSVTTHKMIQLFGRRNTLSGSFVLTALCCVICYFIPAEMPWLRTSAVMVAKMCITSSFTVIFMVSTELFPTSLRATMYAVCSTSGRFGSMVAPQTPMLTQVQDTLPMLVFGAASLMSAVLSFFLPDMGDERLPETVAEAEALGDRGRKKSAVDPPFPSLAPPSPPRSSPPRSSPPRPTPPPPAPPPVLEDFVTHL